MEEEEEGEELYFQQVKEAKSQSTLKQPCKLSNQARRHRQILSYVVCYDNGAIEVCDYVCVCGFYLTPTGPPLLLLLHLQPPRNKARHCVQESPF